jgi:hypothetical protein
LITGGYLAGLDMDSAIATKLAYRGLQARGATATLERKEKRLQALWGTRLAAQVQVLPEFERVIREVRRWFRQIGL